jgi:hypothetical protein
MCIPEIGLSVDKDGYVICPGCDRKVKCGDRFYNDSHKEDCEMLELYKKHFGDIGDKPKQ